LINGQRPVMGAIEKERQRFCSHPIVKHAFTIPKKEAFLD
jgi:hypothetical protein